YETVAEIEAPVIAGPGGGGPLTMGPGRGGPGMGANFPPDGGGPGYGPVGPAGPGRNFPPSRGGGGAPQGQALPQKLRLVKITFAKG
ncbi:MAG: hypothetical protein RIQ93_2460, partial [Verrucomicrobiota bacterium]